MAPGLAFATVGVAALHAYSVTTATAACSVAAIQSNINGFQSDIVADNNFLNTGYRDSPSAVSLTACKASQPTNAGAANEPLRLGALSPCLRNNNRQAKADAQAIMSIIAQIPGNLSIIQANPENKKAVDCALDAINYLRCNYILPDVQGVFDGLEQDYAGLQNTHVSGPVYCPQPHRGSYPSPTQYNLASCGPTLTTSSKCTQT